PKTGHGGIDQAGFLATNSKNRCPTRPRYRPSLKPAAGRLVAPCDCRLTHACPTKVTSVSPVRTANEGTTPTAAPAFIHQLARTIHDSTLPATDTSGSPPDPLSMKSPAFRIASSRASAHNAAGLRFPSERKRSKPRLAISTTPPPARGSSGRPTRRATRGTTAAKSGNA